MPFDIKSTPHDFEDESSSSSNREGFALGAAPSVTADVTPESGGLPRFSGSPTLCLMARDPRTLFAYWDIDWTTAFGDEQPSDKKVHLRVMNEDGAAVSVEVEPLAGSCYIDVENADAIYSGDLGYYQPPAVWHSLATSDLISTPPEDLADLGDDDFATVPFHLSFQRMIDLLRESRRRDTPLVVQLADVRDAIESPAIDANRSASERELADAIRQAEANSPAEMSRENAAELWKRQRLERVLGFGATSPAEGFGGSSRGS